METQTEWQNYSTKIMDPIATHSEPEGWVSLAVRKNEPRISTLLECSLKSRKSKEPIYCQCDSIFKWKPDLHCKAVIRPHGKERRGNGRGNKTPTRDKDEPIRKLAKISISHPWTLQTWTLSTFSPQQGPEEGDNWLYVDFRGKTICFSQRKRNQACEGPQSLRWSSTYFS